MQREQKMSTEHFINLIIALIGIILVIVGVLAVMHQSFSTIMISVGASLLASSVVAFLSSVYIQKYRRAKEISEIWGISSVEDKRTLMNVRIDEYTKSATRSYDVMAFGLKSLRDGNPDGVHAFLRRGGKLRILSVDPDCSSLAERDAQEGKAVGSTSLSIRQLKEWADDLAGKYPGLVQLHFARYLPSEFYCRVDDVIFVGPYQFGKESQQMITIEYRSPGKAFSYYETYFESLWSSSVYCLQADT